ncbi:uncharacterized protein LOC124921657 [Impatiens glandulifera]|uniref:uncharacterized protein LOC124921657 n=1 Tax=Impatiens glandulifera TaxID=253017 RepID=UPI001FB053EC|nr:uncharacterized protein LOC124921657 [Impatiens glandulifera]
MDSNGTPPFYQNVIVMRHGDRLDNFDPLWTTKATRPWDPPLFDAGKVRAFIAGQKLRTQLGFPIRRVFVSPFLRCVQTASEVSSALCAINDDPIKTSSVDIQIDPSKLKVSIEYGLCEMLNREAIRASVAPKDGEFSFNIAELQTLLPSGIVDQSTVPLYDKLPKWGETVLGARARYVQVIKDLADKYPSENLLLVTHGEGVGTAVSAFMKDVTVYEVEYCAFAQLRRNMASEGEKGDFEVVMNKEQTGIGYYPLNNSMEDPFDAKPNA